MSMPVFGKVGQGLAAIDQQQQGLAAGVAAGALWMEGDVAERAAARCEALVEEIRETLLGADVLTRERKFGDNADGRTTAARFAQAGHDYIAVLEHARGVFERMAQTYRSAGRTAAQTEESNQQMFTGGAT